MPSDLPFLGSPQPAEERYSIVIAKLGSEAILTLKVVAYPSPTHYVWYRNTSAVWQTLVNSTAMRITQGSLQYNLTIHSVKTEDYGEYKLIVANGIGESLNYIFILKLTGKILIILYQFV